MNPRGVVELLRELEERRVELMYTPCGTCGHPYNAHRGRLEALGLPYRCEPWSPTGKRRLRCKCKQFVDPAVLFPVLPETDM